KLYYKFNFAIEPKIYYKTFFNNNSQGKKAKSFAIKVNEYLTQNDDLVDNAKWKGNNQYLKEMRNAMTHRSSQNINSLTNFAQNIRLPFIYTLKRVIEDYHQVYLF
uniref:hypothetical protein n=1 Tax=Staphylococcus equorum TaxID=246432 RepID=UPI001C4334D4